MKKIFLSSIIIFLVLPLLQGQKMNNIKTDLFSPFVRTGVIKYERVLNEDMSLQLGYFYTGFTPRDEEFKLNGYGITVEYRYYLSDTHAPSGTYLAPNIRYSNLTVTDPFAGEEATLTSIGLAINLGKQVLLKDVVLIDAWVGPAYGFRSVEGPPNEDDPIPDANGFFLRAGVAIGIAF